MSNSDKVDKGSDSFAQTASRLYAVERQLEQQIRRLTAVNRFTLEVSGAISPIAISRAAAGLLFGVFNLDLVVVLVPGMSGSGVQRILRFPHEEIDRVEVAFATEWVADYVPGTPVIWSTGDDIPPEIIDEIDILVMEACGGRCEELAIVPNVALLPIGNPDDVEGRGVLLAVTLAPGKRDTEIIPGEDDDVFLSLVARNVGAALERAGLVRDLEARVSERTAALAAARTALDTEVAERQAAENRLRLAERLESVGRLALGVGHEINNPLSYIWFNLEYVRDLLKEMEDQIGVARTEELTTPLEEALGGASRIKRIVEDLRIFGRDDKPRNQAVDLHDALDLAVKLGVAEIKPRATVVQSFEATRPVFGDRGRLEQVFVNLLVNAAQAMPEGRASRNQIHISTRDGAEGTNRVLVEIEDTGPGIPAEDLERVFDPFFTTKPLGRGSGLGLSLCHGIVTGMGGQIRLDSQVGVGTRVCLDFPAAETGDAQSPRESNTELTALVQPGSGGVRILIVDDEPLIRRSLSRLLNGYEVATAASGRQAIEMLKNETFDVVICDLMMGDLTGIDVYHAIEVDSPRLKDRVVFITGGAFTDATREFLEHTTNRTLKKPISRKELHAAIAQAIR